MSPRERDSLERTVGILTATVDHVVEKVDEIADRVDRGFEEAREERRSIFSQVSGLTGEVKTLKEQVAPLHIKHQADESSRLFTAWLVKTAKWLGDLAVKGIIITTAIFGLLAARSFGDVANVISALI